MAHLISILIRSKNDQEYIGRTLEAILGQVCAIPFEIVNCDDASSDDTPNIVAKFPQVRRVQRPDGEYFPGRTLNHVIRQCKGDIIVFNNADAIPQHKEWLSNLVKPLLEGNCDAVFANQLPRPDATWLVKKDSWRAFGDGSISAKWDFFFSLASSGTTHKLLDELPFNEAIKYSEDQEWAYKNKLRLKYVADAIVEHSHNYTFAQLKRRFYGEGKADAEIFGTCPSLMQAISRAGMETLRDFVFLMKHPAGLHEIFTAPCRRWIQKIYHRKGALDYFNKK